MKISVRFADANFNPHALWGRAECLKEPRVPYGGQQAARLRLARPPFAAGLVVGVRSRRHALHGHRTAPADHPENPRGCPERYPAGRHNCASRPAVVNSLTNSIVSFDSRTQLPIGFGDCNSVAIALRASLTAAPLVYRLPFLKTVGGGVSGPTVKEKLGSRPRLTADREPSQSESSRPAVLSRRAELPVFWSATPNF